MISTGYENKIWCPRYEPAAPVAPEVCLLHYQKNDPACQRCEYFNSFHDKEAPAKKIREVEY